MNYYYRNFNHQLDAVAEIASIPRWLRKKVTSNKSFDKAMKGVSLYILSPSSVILTSSVLLVSYDDV